MFVRNSQRGVSHLGDGLFEVSAGENLTYLVSHLNKDYNIHTLNTFFGLPGTVGGAIVGNAGSFGVEIGNFVKNIKYVDETGALIETDNYTHEYRSSNLAGKKILLLSAILDTSLILKEGIKEGSWYMNWRMEKQEHIKTTGSFFKNCPISTQELYSNETKYKNLLRELENIEELKKERKVMVEDGLLTIASGWIIDQAGLRGYDIGGVRMSERHANFVINYDNDDASKILELSESVKNTVYNKFGIMLEEEVKIIGHFC
ncbi:MAG: FAD-binding protein [Candidatus Gracilibacteria bacterium]|nr:FAD-binding protein [Candidatus Gracilibacteria bacterium]